MDPVPGAELGDVDIGREPVGVAAGDPERIGMRVHAGDVSGAGERAGRCKGGRDHGGGGNSSNDKLMQFQVLSWFSKPV